LPDNHTTSHSQSADPVRDVLERALGYEIATAKFYEKAIGIADDPETKAVFKGLAMDEGDHQRIVTEQFKKRYPDTEPEPKRSNLPHPTLGSNAETSLDALKAAHGLEIVAHQRYRAAANNASEDDLRRVLAGLADFEHEHVDLLARELKSRGGQPWEEMELDNWVRDD
jgi:rubrerythrin